MKRTTIERLIKEKLNEWLDTITDDSLKSDLKESILVSGGCIASMFLREQVNDYDVYLSNMDIVKRTAEYYRSKIPYFNSIEILDGRVKNSEDINTELHNQYAVAIRNLKKDQIKLFITSGGGLRIDIEPEDMNAKKYLPSYFSPNAISLTDNLQIVLRFHGNSQQIHETFDFVHATNYFTFAEGLVTNTEALESLLTKQLRYQGSKYPLTSIIRSKKFLGRGFTISAGEYLKIMYQISQLDLNNVDVLEEQLIGVDVAYFDKLITILRDHYSRNTDFELNSGYLGALIDKVFNESNDE